jgi:hypothetical protein
MFKKISTIILIGLTIATLTGCNKNAEVPAESVTQDVAESVSKEETVSEEANELNEIFYLTQYDTASLIYTIDADGNLIDTVDRQEISDNIPESEREIYRVFDEDSFSGCLLSSAGGRFLFFNDRVNTLGDGTYNYTVYAVGIDDHNIYPIWQGTSGEYVNSVDCYDGELVIDISYGYDSEKYPGMTEKSFIYDAETNSFVEKENDMEAILERARIEKLNIFGSRFRGPYNPFSLKRTMDECKFIIGTQDDGLSLIDESGIIKKLPGTSDVYMAYYSPDVLLYSRIDMEDGTTKAFVYDLQSETEKAITGPAASFSFLGREDDTFYYYIQGKDQQGVTCNSIYRYDAVKDTNTLLYEKENIPGVSIGPGVEGFKIYDGNIYMIDLEGSELKWFRGDATGDGISFSDTGLKVSEVEILKYGQVSYTASTHACPDCGTVLSDKYAEYFILDSGLSGYADKINAYLKEQAENIVNADLESGEDYYGTTCDEHSIHPAWYCITDEWSVTDVSFIRDNCMTVQMAGYWYGGGAHGYPERNQYLFDLTTGEVLTIRDFFEGTEEEFKALIAAKTREDYEHYLESNPDEMPYFASDEDTVYNDAYEYTSLDSGCIEFLQDGIIYYYPPYDMGPYAAGYIEIFVPYEELGKK